MKFQYILTISSGLLENIFFSGVVLGWPSLQWVLLKEGYFEYLCENIDTTTHANDTSAYTNISSLHNKDDEFISCKERKEALNLAFTLAVSIQYIISCLTGIILDKFGTFTYRMMAIACFIVAYILLAVSSSSSSVLVYLAVTLIPIGGSAIGTSNIQSASLAGPLKGVVISMFNGTYTGAAVVFLIVKFAYKAGFPIFSIFCCLACMAVFPIARSFVLMPKKYIPLPLPPSGVVVYGWKEWICIFKFIRFLKLSKSTKSITMENQTMTNIEIEEEEEEEDGMSEIDISSNDTSYDEHRVSFQTSIRSALFWTNAFHFWVGHIRISFYYGVFVDWIKTFENPDNIENIISVFGIILLAGIVLSPVSGLIFDGAVKYYKMRRICAKFCDLRASFITMFTCSALLSFLSISVLFSQIYVSIAFLLLSGFFVYSGNWTFLAIAFPVEHFGKLLGITQTFSGIGTLGQTPLYKLALKYDPNFKFVNISFLILSLLTFVHPIFLYKKAFKTS